jgi:fumarate hydratase subunit beta
MEYILKTPVSKTDIAPLRAGDTVKLSGVVYTARDAAHKRLVELIDRGEPLPFELPGSAIYYVGPTPERPGEVIGSAGPTTSGRMDAYSPRLIALGQSVMIGKGRRSQTVKDAMVKYGAVYLAAVGGAGALMARCVKSVDIICWEDLGCEAVRRLVVEDMPLTVVIDTLGSDLYQLGPENYLNSLK